MGLTSNDVENLIRFEGVAKLYNGAENQVGFVAIVRAWLSDGYNHYYFYHLKTGALLYQVGGSCGCTNKTPSGLVYSNSFRDSMDNLYYIGPKETSKQ